MANIEGGKRIYLEQTPKRDLYLQLEGQATYTFTTGYSITTSNGLEIETKPVTSFMGRAGFRIGMDNIADDTLNPYFKFMYEREFLGRTRHIFNETAVEDVDNNDGWINYGFGMTNINKKKGRQIYFEVQGTVFRKVNQVGQVNLGIRYTF